MRQQSARRQPQAVTGEREHQPRSPRRREASRLRHCRGRINVTGIAGGNEPRIWGWPKAPYGVCEHLQLKGQIYEIFINVWWARMSDPDSNNI
jgi:hypothetical protein